jgi:hypothetical protein
MNVSTTHLPTMLWQMNFWSFIGANHALLIISYATMADYTPFTTGWGKIFMTGLSNMDNDQIGAHIRRFYTTGGLQDVCDGVDTVHLEWRFAVAASATKP